MDVTVKFRHQNVNAVKNKICVVQNQNQNIIVAVLVKILKTVVTANKKEKLEIAFHTYQKPKLTYSRTKND